MVQTIDITPTTSNGNEIIDNRYKILSEDIEVIIEQYCNGMVSVHWVASTPYDVFHDLVSNDSSIEVENCVAELVYDNGRETLNLPCEHDGFHLCAVESIHGTYEVTWEPRETLNEVVLLIKQPEKTQIGRLIEIYTPDYWSGNDLEHVKHELNQYCSEACFD